MCSVGTYTLHFSRALTAPARGTTDAMILRRFDGSYQIADIGNDSISGSYSFKQFGSNWGSDWGVITLGNFADGDTTDLLLRNTNASDRMPAPSRSTISRTTTSHPARSLGTVGLDWAVMGFGNFSSRGETDMIMRNSKTGDVEVYDIKNDQITGSASLGNIGLDWQVAGGFAGLGKSPRRQFQQPGRIRPDPAQRKHRSIAGLGYQQQPGH